MEGLYTRDAFAVSASVVDFWVSVFIMAGRTDSSTDHGIMFDAKTIILTDPSIVIVLKIFRCQLRNF